MSISRRARTGLVVLASLVAALTASLGPAAAQVAPPAVHINEIESNGGTPGDWVELVNTGSTQIDVSGWMILDNDNTHAFSILPAGSTIAAGGYLIVEEAALGFGLGGADSVRLFDATSALHESYGWTAHAATTYGRCPNGTGAFTTTTSVTKGAANDCSSAVGVNEVESNGGTPGDWVELINPSGSPVDLSGFVVRDNDDSHTYTIPSATVVAAGGFYVVEEVALGFGLGGADSARLFSPGGALVDSYAWTAHATTTYGRCPDGAGPFIPTASSTKGAANACGGSGGPTFLPWPGGTAVTSADGTNVFGGNLSGLDYEGTGTSARGVLWAVRNNPGTLYRLVFNGSTWTPDPNGGWVAGKALRYPDGTGNPDAEGVTFADAGSAAGLYVATERDNNVGGASRLSVLRFDPAAAGATLSATQEWNLTADLPAVGPNLGFEAITWIPDSFLVSRSLLDESKGRLYAPADYPGHGSGLFFLGMEATGTVYAYALQAGGGFTRVATILSGFPGVMGLEFDADEGDLWAVCDDTCLGRSAVLRIDQSTGKFVVVKAFERPVGMTNLNNEGFAIASGTECATNVRPVFWADDAETGGHSIRQGTMNCTRAAPSISTAASPGNLLGAPVSDTATVSGGTSPGGSVTFRLFSDFRCTDQVFISTNAVAGGAATSSAFTPTTAGTYFWTASYSGDANNYPATAPCGAPNESVTIAPFVAPPITRTVTGDLTGPLTVAAGQSVLVSSARVVGPITVNAGGSLSVVNSQVARGIVADRPAFFSVCGSQVSGPSTSPGQGIVVSNASVPVRVGDPAAGCAFNRVAGDVILTANTAGLTVGSNIVYGNVTVNSTVGTAVIKANSIVKALACAGNSPLPTNAGQPNTAGSKSGQCTTL